MCVVLSVRYCVRVYDVRPKMLHKLLSLSTNAFLPFRKWWKRSIVKKALSESSKMSGVSSFCSGDSIFYLCTFIMELLRMPDDQISICYFDAHQKWYYCIVWWTQTFHLHHFGVFCFVFFPFCSRFACVFFCSFTFGYKLIINPLIKSPPEKLRIVCVSSWWWAARCWLLTRDIES